MPANAWRMTIDSASVAIRPAQVLVELVRLSLPLAHHRARIAYRAGHLPPVGPGAGGLARPPLVRGVLVSRSRISADPPAGTATSYQAAAFVPVRSGLTVAEPLMTWSLMPSFGKGVVAAVPKIRSAFVSFSQNSSSAPAAVGSGADVQGVVTEEVVAGEDGRAVLARSRAQVARPTSRTPTRSGTRGGAGRGWSAASAARLRTTMRIRMSVGSAFA